MANIFISYVPSGKEIVKDYAHRLEKQGHKVVLDDTVLTIGSKIQESLEKAQAEADGTISFISKQSKINASFNQELRNAIKYSEFPRNKFFIPIIADYSDIPDEIRGLKYLELKKFSTDAAIAEIEKAIERHIREKSPQANHTNIGSNYLPQELHDKVLLFLLEYRKSNQDFTFWLRKKNTKNRFNKGFWFQGREDYVFVGLYNTWAGNNSTKGIGLVFWPNEDEIGISFVVIYREEERTNYLKFYESLKNELLKNYGSKIEDKVNEFSVVISDNNGLELSKAFLDHYKRIFDELIIEFGLQEIMIQSSKFEDSLSKTLQIRDQIIRGEIKSLDIDEEDNDRSDDLLDFPLLQGGKNNNVNLQIDSPTVDDSLGRRPFVDALFEYIKRLWSNRELADSYTIHIDGEWGSGKSTVMTLLRERLRGESGSAEKQWIVVEFNAWQNQHIQAPWWVLLDSAFRAILKNVRWWTRPIIYLREFAWRIFSMNSGKWLTLIILFTVFIISFNSLKPSQQSFVSAKDIGELLKVILSFLSLIGSIWLFILGIMNSLLPGGEDAAKNYKLHVTDPMKRIKEHYGTIINYTSKNVAVFIDDIDRCDPKMVVGLLEGLQTLFKSEKVLYVIAGDASWIRKSFEVHYSALMDTVNRQGQSLGNFFVEKTLQQSITLPPITEELKKSFWNKLLGGKAPEIKDAESIKKIQSAKSESEMSEIIEQAQGDEKTKLREAAAKKVSSKEIMKEIEHELLRYHELLEPNPRSMKRLINNIALERASNFLGGVNDKIDQDTLIRWAILKSAFPLVAIEIKHNVVQLQKYSDNKQFPEVSRIIESINIEDLQFLSA